MFRRFKLKRQIALTLIVTMVMQFVYAGVAYALSEGPAQPEALQFEPVDTTDLVNLATGDFTYNIPLFDLPGPEGNYPLSLNYHSGIGTNQEATWVGLGWNVNPGAINRSLNGLPDDYFNKLVESHFEGNSETIWGVGLTLGYGPVGLNIQWDSYRGLYGGNIIFRYSPDNSPISASISIGTNSSVGINYGDFSGNIGFSHGISLGFGYNHFSAWISSNLSGDNSVGFGFESLQISFNSKTKGANFNIAGVGFNTSSQPSEGNAWGFSMPIPLPLPPPFWAFLTLSAHGWDLYETYDEPSFGYLHQAGYHGNHSSSKKYERQRMGDYLYSSQDIYTANAQGINGILMPFVEDHYTLYDYEDHSQKGQLFTEGYSTNQVSQFRFLNDQGANFVTFDSENLNGQEFKNIDYYNTGSNKITHFYGTDGQIDSFYVYDSEGKLYVYSQRVQNTYMYSYTVDKSNPNVYLNNYSSLFDPFTTNWLLTAIKGPDYVDVNQNCICDEEDWGYWVKFKYEKEESPQIWRAPYSGKSISPISNKIETFSIGIRDYVYLKSMESATHKAEFNTSAAKDRYTPADFSNAYQVCSIEETTNGVKFIIEGTNFFDNINNLDYSTPLINFTAIYRPNTHDTIPCDNDYVRQLTLTRGQLTVTSEGSKTILTLPNLTKNERTVCTWYSSEWDEWYSVWYDRNFIKNDSKGSLILTNILNDIGKYSVAKKLDEILIYNKSVPDNPLKKIKFNYDYLLCPNTPNSEAKVTEGDGANGAKLTLMSVEFKGKTDQQVFPPYLFKYANDSRPGEGLNPSYNEYDWDVWGSYRYPGLNNSERGIANHNTPDYKHEADRSAAWSLTNIITPTGAQLSIEYESDDYFYASDTYDFSKSKSLHTSHYKGVTTSEINLNLFDLSVGSVAVGPGNIVFFYQKVNGNYYFDKRKVISENCQAGIINLDSPIHFRSGSTWDYIMIIYGHDRYLPNNSCIETNYVNEQYGGGIRVKSICLNDINKFYKTIYKYQTLDYDDALISSGVTASIPLPYGAKIDITEHWHSVPVSESIPEFKEFNRVFLDHPESYGRPAPAVIYSQVEVMGVDPENNDKPTNGKTVYEFFTAKDYGYEVIKDNANGIIRIEDNSGINGKLKKVTYYRQYDVNQQTNFKPVQSTIYNYAFSCGTTPGEYLFEKANVKDKNGNLIDINPNDNNSEIYPLGATVERYKHSVENIGTWHIDKIFNNVFNVGYITTNYDDNGTPIIAKETKNFLYDALSGNILAKAELDSKQNTNISRTTPAYWKYPSIYGRHMYSQTCKNEKFRTDSYIFGDEDLKSYNFPYDELLSSEIITWANGWNNPTDWTVWRINDKYIYNKSMDMDDGYFHDFNDWNLSTNISYPPVTPSFPWQMISNITKYNRYSSPIEERYVDDEFGSVKYVYDESLVGIIAKNAKLGEIGNNDFEDGWGSWETGGNAQSSFISFEVKNTGNSSVKSINSFGPTKNFFVDEGIDKNKEYLFEGWIYRINGTATMKIEVRNSSGAGIFSKLKEISSGAGWQYISVKITPQEMQELASGGYLRIWCGFIGNDNIGFIDDLRFKPIQANVTSFTYDRLTWNVTSIIDNNSNITYYEYDKDTDRLRRILDKDKNIVKAFGDKFGVNQ